MNKRQKDILEFLVKMNPSEFITQDKIAENTGLDPQIVGSECYKLREVKFIDPGNPEINGKIKYRITVIGQRELDKENNSKKNLILTSLTTYGTLILAIATIVLAVGTVMLAQDSTHQTSIMQNDFDINNRPWIGGTAINIIDNYIQYEYQNFGKIPNTSGNITQSTSLSPISKKDLILNQVDKETIPIIMPTQKMAHSAIILRQDLIESALEGNYDLFVGVLIDYQYGDNKTGQFGSIFKYDKNQKTFLLIDSWSD